MKVLWFLAHPSTLTSSLRGLPHPGWLIRIFLWSKHAILTDFFLPPHLMCCDFVLSYNRHGATSSHENSNGKCIGWGGGVGGLWNFSLHVGLDSSSMKFDNWYAVSMLLRQNRRGEPGFEGGRAGGMLWSRAPDEMGYLSFSNCNTSVCDSDILQEEPLFQISLLLKWYRH